MSSEENKKIKEDKKQIDLNSSKLKKEKSQKETDNMPQKKTEEQFPSSTMASVQNQDLIKVETPSFLNNNTNINEANNKFNFFQSTKVDNADNKGNEANSNDKICCYCTKTRCIKKYCECFSNNRYCKNCHCINCLNKFIHLGNELPKESFEANQVFCTCTKSNCNKKYCECFKSSQKCTIKCRCINCKNCNKQTTFNFNVTNTQSIDKINNNSNINKNLINNDVISNVNNSIANLCDNKSEIIDLEEKEENERNNSNKSNSRKSSLDSNDSLQIQRVSVYINKYQTVIDVEKFTKEMMMFNSKKRKKV